MDVGQRLTQHDARLRLLETRTADLGSELTDERDSRAKEIIRLDDRVHDVDQALKAKTAGDLRFRWWSALIIVVGIALGTWPAGVAHFFA